MQQFQSDHSPSWLPKATVGASCISEKKTKRIPASERMSMTSVISL